MKNHQTPNPRTEAQKTASHRNGARSHGPITLEGKNISRANACHHGLLSKVLLIEGESRQIFREFVTHLESTFLPVTPYELTLVETMAIAKLRQMRLARMERAGVRHQLCEHSQRHDATPFPADPATRAWIAFSGINRQHRTLELMNRCESCCDRQYNKALTMLLEAQRRN
jgi:hypothetical protein